jgi:hypothetical protein
MPLQSVRKQLNDFGNISLIKITQGCVFCYFNDPHPGIRQYRAKQFLSFCQVQSIRMGKVRRWHSHLLGRQSIATADDRDL